MASYVQALAMQGIPARGDPKVWLLLPGPPATRLLPLPPPPPLLLLQHRLTVLRRKQQAC